jgi:hypothetical protein
MIQRILRESRHPRNTRQTRKFLSQNKPNARFCYPLAGSMTEENWQTVTGKSAMIQLYPEARDSTFSIVDIDL